MSYLFCVLGNCCVLAFCFLFYVKYHTAHLDQDFLEEEILYLYLWLNNG